MTGTIAVILVFGGLIFFHELGHFLVARIFGIGVKTFSLGFGPALVSRVRGKTRYQVAALPLGGFVSLVGESPEAEVPEPFTPAESFSLRPAWQRFLVIAAGSVFNLLLAWLICWGVLYANGSHRLEPVIGEIVSDSPAAESALRAGDRVLSLGGREISTWEEIPRLIQRNEGKELQITVRRGEDSVTFSIRPKLLTQTLPDGKALEFWGIGIRPAPPAATAYGFFEAGKEGLHESGRMMGFIWKALADLLSRKVSVENVGGPILIAQTIYQQADRGLVEVLMLAAFISVNLGVLNLLPIPVLDGGHLIFLLTEMVIGRRLPQRQQERAMMIGLALLLGLMLLATFNDIVRLVN